MAVNSLQSLPAKIKAKAALSQEIQQACQKILPNTDFSIGQIKRKRLQIYTSAHNLTNLRRYEAEIMRLRHNFDFKTIEWRTLVTTQAAPRTKVIRTKPKKTNLRAIANKCRNKKLQEALKKLSTTLK